MEWFFDGLGTMLLGLVLGGAAGGAAGYRLGAGSVRQRQSAGDKSRQTQIGGDTTRG